MGVGFLRRAGQFSRVIPQVVNGTGVTEHAHGSGLGKLILGLTALRAASEVGQLEGHVTNRHADQPT